MYFWWMFQNDHVLVWILEIPCIFCKVGDFLSHVFPMKMLSHSFNKMWDSWMKQLLMIPLNKSQLKFQWSNNFVNKIIDELFLKNVLFVFQWILEEFLLKVILFFLILSYDSKCNWKVFHFHQESSFNNFWHRQVLARDPAEHFGDAFVNTFKIKYFGLIFLSNQSTIRTVLVVKVLKLRFLRLVLE